MMVIIGSAIFITIATFIALTKPKSLYFIMVFFAGWYGIFVDIGLRITVYRLIIIIFLLYLPIYLSLRKNAVRFPVNIRYLLVFIYYTIIVSLIGQLYIPEGYVEGFTRGEGRWIFQIAMLFIDITPAFIPLLFFTKKEDIKTTAKVFIASTTILCLFGWVQVLAFYLFKMDIFPLYREGLTGTTRQVVAPNIAGIGNVIRMHSFGGEPKHFAITVAIAIILLVVFRIYTKNGVRFGYPLMAFFLISLFMSLSTSGFFVLFMGLTLLIILASFSGHLGLNSVFKQVTIIATIPIIFFILIIVTGILLPHSLAEIVLLKTIARSPIELFDAATIDFLFTQPQYLLFGVGTGNIHLYAWDHLIKYAIENQRAVWVLNADVFVFVSNSGYLRTLSEVGIVGLILFLFTFLIPIWSNFKCSRHINDKNDKAMLLGLNIFAIFVLIVYLMRVHQINYAYIVLGQVYFINREIKSHRELNENCNKHTFNSSQ